MSISILKTAALAAAFAFLPGMAVADDAQYVGPIKEFVAAKVSPWLSDPAVIGAIKDQNGKTAAYSDADIQKLDKQWRAEVDAPAKPLIDSVLKDPLSAFLAKKKEAAAGIITEVFVTDAKGLNVGQSDVTSDYWQGDEAKWQKTFLVGPDAIFVDKVEKDESTQALQSQVSVTIKDETGKAIGAITLGINVDGL